MPQLAGMALVPVSGLTGYGIDALMKAVVAADTVWNRRVPTPALNRWLSAVQQRHPPPLVSGRRLRLRYMTQVNTRPPSFALFASKPGELPDSYRRYLVNALRHDFDLPGTPDPADAAPRARTLTPATEYRRNVGGSWTISPLLSHSGTARSTKASVTLSGGGSVAGSSPGKMAARRRVRTMPGSIRLARTRVSAAISPA